MKRSQLQRDDDEKPHDEEWGDDAKGEPDHKKKEEGEKGTP